MIYDFPNKEEPIKQGDLFFPLPFNFMRDLDNIIYINDDETIEEASWEDISDKSINAIVNVKPVWGIVASQDCDASRVPYITFFLIDTFRQITKLTTPDPTNPKKWQSFLTTQSRKNAGWFYLPLDVNIDFSERMVVDFEEVFLVKREYLEANITALRKGRLNNVSYQHYREKASQYFRRYPYDEWYPLSIEEFNEYKKEREDKGLIIEPFKWQAKVKEKNKKTS
ncbi:MAG: hypothetical protein ACTSO7_17335 [Candidatus Heimdallarchaeota archaeon]